MTVKVRIAPSPTGNLHIGTARTALFNWLFARRHGGEFILRVEDTDVERSTRAYEENIVDGLRWLGLDWDNTEIYRQSERTDTYRTQLRKLLDSGKAVWRDYTDEEKAAMRERGVEARDRIIVLKDDSNPERELTFDDIIRGRVSVQRKHVGSLALAKDEDTPLYNFAVVVDDLDMGITHVIRGEDHVSNTPKQLLIYEAMGAPPPAFAHLPLILGSDRSKMSKRHGATSIAEYRSDYLPDALVNFMGALGYTYDRELLTKEEMAAQFDLAHVHKSGAVFDLKKLNWVNAQYIKMLPPRTFKDLVGHPELPDAAVPLMTERLERLSAAAEFAYLWEEPHYDGALLRWKDATAEETRSALQLLTDAAARDPYLTQDGVQAIADAHFAGQKGKVFWPLRVALSGRAASAGPMEIAGVIGPARVKARLDEALRICA